MGWLQHIFLKILPVNLCQKIISLWNHSIEYKRQNSGRNYINGSLEISNDTRCLCKGYTMDTGASVESTDIKLVTVNILHHSLLISNSECQTLVHGEDASYSILLCTQRAHLFTKVAVESISSIFSIFPFPYWASSTWRRSPMAANHFQTT